jgi:hypothetical protein
MSKLIRSTAIPATGARRPNGPTRDKYWRQPPAFSCCRNAAPGCECLCRDGGRGARTAISRRSAGRSERVRRARVSALLPACVNSLAFESPN